MNEISTFPSRWLKNGLWYHGTWCTCVVWVRDYASKKLNAFAIKVISVIGHIVKMVEQLVRSQLVDYLEEHSYITPDQSAYLKGHSTQTSLHRVIDDWLENINENQVCVFLKSLNALKLLIILFCYKTQYVWDKTTRIEMVFFVSRYTKTSCALSQQTVIICWCNMWRTTRVCSWTIFISIIHKWYVAIHNWWVFNKFICWWLYDLCIRW